jgi:TonB family protein
VLLRGPAPPRNWPVGPYFPDAWLHWRTDWQLFWLSAVFHVLVLVLPFRIALARYRPAAEGPQRAEVAWMGGSSRVLLPYLPPPRKESRKAASRGTEDAAKRGANAFHPRQTIVSKPEVATHPRQTLIEPAAAPEAPKILPPLPDIVEWPNLSKPARHLRLNPAARMRQKLAQPRRRSAAPEVRAALPEIAFTSEHPDLPKPALEVKASARPTFAAEKHAEEVAPEIPATPSVDLAGQRLIALSENPAPPPPDLQVPSGNLRAQFALSPDGSSPGTAGSAPVGSGIATSGKHSGGGRAAGVPGVAIVGTNRGPVSNIAGPPGAGGNGQGFNLQPRPFALPPQPGTPAAPGDESHTAAPSIQERIKGTTQPEDLLEPGRIYTLHVSMPNLASVTGTWTLKFVELDENGKEIGGTMDSPAVAGPVPLRKVDPKYPPAFISARVQGDVVLYAIIRRDGTVDSIEVVRSLDPQLDQNAMQALSRWRFQAAQREGRAVELAAIVRIPFRATSPLY